MKHLLYISVLCVLLTACWDRKPESGDEETEISSALADSFDYQPDTLILFDKEEIPEAVDELFADFLYSFMVDPSFQLKRVVFPLRVKEDDSEQTIDRNAWKSASRFAARDFYSVLYEREEDLELLKDTSINTVGVEWYNLSDGQMERFNFQRIDGQWLLTDGEQKPTSQTSLASFAAFYAKFSSDTAFQSVSIDFPLPLVTEDVDEEFEDEDIDQMMLSAESWPEFRQQMPFPEQVLTNIDYGQMSISQNRKVLLVESMGSSMYVKYKFDRSGDQWRLYEIEY